MPSVPKPFLYPSCSAFSNARLNFPELCRTWLSSKFCLRTEKCVGSVELLSINSVPLSLSLFCDPVCFIYLKQLSRDKINVVRYSEEVGEDAQRDNRITPGKKWEKKERGRGDVRLHPASQQALPETSHHVFQLCSTFPRCEISH